MRVTLTSDYGPYKSGYSFVVIEKGRDYYLNNKGFYIPKNICIEERVYHAIRRN